MLSRILFGKKPTPTDEQYIIDPDCKEWLSYVLDCYIDLEWRPAQLKKFIDDVEGYRSDDKSLTKLEPWKRVAELSSAHRKKFRERVEAERSKAKAGSSNRRSSSTRPGSGASQGTPRSSGSSRTSSSSRLSSDGSQGYPGNGSTPRSSSSSRRATSVTKIDIKERLELLDAARGIPLPGQRSSQGTKGGSGSSRTSSSSQLSSGGSSGYQSSNGSSRTSTSRQRSSGGSQGCQKSSGSTPRSASSSRRSSQSSLGTQSSRRSATSHSTLGDDACIVCMDNLANAVLAPCGHHNLCMGCAERLSSKICPTCRAPFSMIIKKVG